MCCGLLWVPERLQERAPKKDRGRKRKVNTEAQPPPGRGEIANRRRPDTPPPRGPPSQGAARRRRWRSTRPSSCLPARPTRWGKKRPRAQVHIRFICNPPYRRPGSPVRGALVNLGHHVDFVGLATGSAGPCGRTAPYSGRAHDPTVCINIHHTVPPVHVLVFVGEGVDKILQLSEKSRR